MGLLRGWKNTTGTHSIYHDVVWWFVWVQCSTHDSPQKSIVLTFDCIFFAMNIWPKKKQIHFTAALAAWVAVDWEGPGGSRWRRSGGPGRGPPVAPCDQRHPLAPESYCTVSRNSSGHMAITIDSCDHGANYRRIIKSRPPVINWELRTSSGKVY